MSTTFTINDPSDGGGYATPASPTPLPIPPSSDRVPAVLPTVVPSVSTLVIPLAAVQSQVLAVSLGDQQCRIDIYQKSTGLYLDLHVADRPIVLGVLCRDRNLIVRDAYRGFVGDLTLYDTQGLDDPYFTGLGSRWQLVWAVAG